MGKNSIFLYLTATLLLLFFLSHYSPKKQTGDRHGRLKLRSNFTFSSSHRPVAFDPLVAEIERRREERQWKKRYSELSHKDSPANDSSAPGEESQPELDDFIDAEDYLNDEGKFNITDRLILLFPRIDEDPADGFVNEHELTEWNLQQAQRDILHRAKREMDVHDKNHDGFLSFSEYEPPSWVHSAGSVSRTDF